MYSIYFDFSLYLPKIWTCLCFCILFHASQTAGNTMISTTKPAPANSSCFDYKCNCVMQFAICVQPISEFPIGNFSKITSDIFTLINFGTNCNVKLLSDIDQFKRLQAVWFDAGCNSTASCVDAADVNGTYLRQITLHNNEYCRITTTMPPLTSPPTRKSTSSSPTTLTVTPATTKPSTTTKTSTTTLTSSTESTIIPTTTSSSTTLSTPTPTPTPISSSRSSNALGRSPVTDSNMMPTTPKCHDRLNPKVCMVVKKDGFCTNIQYGILCQLTCGICHLVTLPN